jgi:hypothetical protein
MTKRGQIIATLSVPCHHGMARCQAAQIRGGLRIYEIRSRGQLKRSGHRWEVGERGGKTKTSVLRNVTPGLSLGKQQQQQ